MLRKDKKSQKEFLIKLMNRREHLNVWDTTAFKSFLNKTIKSNNLNFKRIKEITPIDNNFEYIVLLRKPKL